ncbi:MAG: FAD binding domain-containing protein [Xanthobacteraceae bacterium]
MTPFELAEPKSLKDAVALLDAGDPTVRPIAGGTALMLMMKAGVFRPSKLVSLSAIEELIAINAANGELKVGAMTPLAVLERSDAVKKHAPVITRTLRTLSNVRVRNVATVGGSLAHADPHMDLPPVLMALGARVTVAGKSGERTIPVEELFVGYYETVLKRDELIASLAVPPQDGRRAVYLKCTTRAVHDWPALGVAVSVVADGNTIRDARIVISAATEKASRMPGAENTANGAADDAALRRAGDAAAEEAEVIEDAQGSVAYKKELVRVYVARALRAALGAT